MGLMLSILVVCVGVIEALSCYEHFQYGLLHCATNLYEHARRRSSVFLNYTSRRLKLLSEDSIAEDDHESSLRSELINEPVDDFINYEPRKRHEGENKSKSGKKLAKFEKQDKIELVKQLLEKPSRPPRAVRSISMPERTSLIYTEKDLELTKIINELAIEPIDEINVEVEEVDDESVIEEFDKLFDESEGKLNKKIEKSTTHDIESAPTENLNVEEYNNENEVVVEKSIQDTESGIKVDENEEDEEKNESKTNTKSISQKISKFDRPVKISRSTSIDLDKVSLLLSKSTSVDSDRPKKQTIPKNLPEINSAHKSPSDIEHPSSINVIFESEQPPESIDKTFEELFGDMNDEFSNEENVELNEIENIIIEALDDETVENLGKEFISNEIARYIENNKTEIKNQKVKDKCRDMDVSGEPISEKYLDILNKFADRIVCECLSEIRNLEVNNLKLEILKNDEKAKNIILDEIQSEKLSLNLSESGSDKIKEIPKQPVTESSDFSNIKLLEANDKPIILENHDEEQRQEPLNERKMTDENKNKNLTPDKLQLSLEEETTESSGRSSPTGSVVTILSVGSDDSTGSKPPEVTNETQNLKTPEKILALTNEPVPALEYKNPVSDVCKQVEIIPMKWTDQVDKELTAKKDVIEIMEEPDQQEPAEKAQKTIKSVSENLEEIPIQDKVLSVKDNNQEVEYNKQETKPTESLVSNKIQENLIVEEKPNEAKSKEIECLERQIVQENKNDNSKSILPTIPKPEANLEKILNDENKPTNIPNDKKPSQDDVIIKSIEEVITAAPTEVLADQKKELKESLEIEPLLKTDKLKGDEVAEKIFKKETTLLRLEKPPEVLAITAENLLAIDYSPKVGTAPIENAKKETIPMDWKTENGVLETGKEKLETEEVHKNFSDNQIMNKEVEVKESKPENNTSLGNNEMESLKLVDVSVVEESKKDGCPKKEVQENTSDNQKIEQKESKPETKISLDDNKKEKLIDSSVVDELKEVCPKEEVQKSISENHTAKQKIEVLESKPEKNTSSTDAEKEKLQLKDTPSVEEPKKDVCPKEEAHKNIPDIQNVDEEIKKKESKPETKTSLDDNKKEKLIDTSAAEESKKDVTPEEEVQKDIPDNQTAKQKIEVLESKPESKTSLDDNKQEKLIDTSVVKEVKEDVCQKKEVQTDNSANQNVKDKIEVKESKPEINTSLKDSEKENLQLKDTSELKKDVTPKEEVQKGISENQTAEKKNEVKESKPETKTSFVDSKKEELIVTSVVEESKEGPKEKVEKPKSEIKEEAVLALEYKRKGNANAEKSKEEIIPMEWKVDKEAPKSEETTEMIKDPNAEETKSLGATIHKPDTKVAENQSVVPEKASGAKPKRKEKKEKKEMSSTSSDENAKKSGGPDTKEGKQSAPEAFWLIFSGEYTKAMSKDWHSGHFSCWQCDEALTGQRYVLRDDHPYCIKCYESVFANVCEECNKIIGIDSKDLSYKDKHWHEACFLCNKCRVSLVDKQFGSKADKIYCGNCYDAQFASRCDGCGEIFRAGTKKMEYKTRQWHEKCFCCCVCKTPIGTKSFIPREQEIYCATCYEEKFATRCVKCNKIITSGGVTYKNEPWHRECFTCTNCNTSLAGQRFTSRDEKPYCADCFGELFAKRCTSCSRPITGIGGTRFISFEDRHWHNDCFICASCKTSLVGRGFITDGDDIICPDCAKQKLM